MHKMDKNTFMEMMEEILCPKLPYRSVNKDYNNEQYFKPEVCKECGGECCKRCGCDFSPDDFEEISFEYLKGQLEKGYISIVFIDGDAIYDDVGVFILRMRNCGMPIVDSGNESAPCILWKENKGCEFDYNHRPTGGRLLIPTEEISRGLSRRCHSTYSLTDCCYEWKPHQKILHQLMDYFDKKDIPCSL